MKKTFLSAVAFIFLVQGCASPDYHIAAYTDVGRYALSMSSTPGLPVIFEISGSDYDHFEVTCEEGEIFTWDNRTGAGDRGDRLSFDKKDSRIYWVPDIGTEEDVTMKISLFRDGKKVYGKKYTIEYAGGGVFEFKGDE